MLRKAAVAFAAGLILLVGLPRPFFAQSAPACGVGQSCSVSIDLPNCVTAQVDFNVPAGSFHGYWTTTDTDDPTTAWDDTCDDDACEGTDFFNGDFDGQGIAVVSYTIEWTNPGSQAAFFYDAFCTDTNAARAPEDR